MTTQIRFSSGREFKPGPKLRNLAAASEFLRSPVADDPSAAVISALSASVEFPPLTDAIVPGDRVAIAVASGVPQRAQVVSGVVSYLLEADVALEEIAVVLPAGCSAECVSEIQQALPAESAEIILHDPTIREQLSFLGAAKDAKPVYLNRVLCDADLVIPIGCIRATDSFGYMGVSGSLFPEFADEETQLRFSAPCTVDSGKRQRRRSEADEAAWLLGAIFTLQIIPGRGDSILQAMAGQAKDVERQALQACDKAWNFKVPRRPTLVVATIEGTSDEQNWRSFAAALDTAGNAVEDDGAIVLCTDLQAATGAALGHLINCDEDVAAQRIRRERSPDADAANVLLDVRQRAKVYLLSGLGADIVEALGMGFVLEPNEIERLIDQHTECVFLPDAHRAAIVQGETTV